MKHRNQILLNEKIKKIKEFNLNEKQIEELIKDIEFQLEQARYEVEKISPYTSPEEVEKRRETMYYYENFLEEIINLNRKEDWIIVNSSSEGSNFIYGPYTKIKEAQRKLSELYEECMHYEEVEWLEYNDTILRYGWGDYSITVSLVRREYNE